jgi:hypothetical protein
VPKSQLQKKYAWSIGLFTEMCLVDGFGLAATCGERCSVDSQAATAVNCQHT